jgi:hypothetical protein
MEKTRAAARGSGVRGTGNVKNALTTIQDAGSFRTARENVAPFGKGSFDPQVDSPSFDEPFFKMDQTRGNKKEN